MRLSAREAEGNQASWRTLPSHGNPSEVELCERHSPSQDGVAFVCLLLLCLALRAPALDSELLDKLVRDGTLPLCSADFDSPPRLASR